jgi:hypothetical protein
MKNVCNEGKPPATPDRHCQPINQCAFHNHKPNSSATCASRCRILVHDTRSSTSLLQSLGIKDKLRYYDRYVGFTRLDLGAAEVNANP